MYRCFEWRVHAQHHIESIDETNTIVLNGERVVQVLSKKSDVNFQTETRY